MTNPEQTVTPEQLLKLAGALGHKAAIIQATEGLKKIRVWIFDKKRVAIEYDPLANNDQLVELMVWMPMETFMKAVEYYKSGIKFELAFIKAALEEVGE